MIIVGIIGIVTILIIIASAISSNRREKKKRRTTTNDYGLYDSTNPLSPWNAKDPGHTKIDSE